MKLYSNIRRTLWNLTAFLALSVPAVASAGTYAYITNQGGANVSVIDTATNTVVTTVNLGAAGGFPAGVGVKPDGTRVYVASSSPGALTVIDTATNTAAGTITMVGLSPQGVAVNPAGTQAWVTLAGSNSVVVIDTSTLVQVTNIGVGTTPLGVAFNASGTRAYVANSSSNDLTVIETVTNTVVATIPVGTSPNGVAVHPDGSRVYVANDSSNTVSVINTTSNTVVAIVPTGQLNTRTVAVNPAGTRVYAVNASSNNVSVIDTSTNTVIGTPLAVGAGPYGIALDPTGARAYVANGSANTVSVIDTAGPSVMATVGVGSGPLAFGLFVVTVAPTIPGAPTGISATAGNGQATVTFTAPSNGGSAITSYTAMSNPSGITASAATSPITVAGLTNGTAYTFTVVATNGVGTGPASSASNSVTPFIANNVVTNNGDTATIGSGSLRAAINYVNSIFCDGANTIQFQITGSPVISPATQLPTLNCGMTIDGYSQAGSSTNSSTSSNSANIQIVLNGQSCVPTAPATNCRGLVANGSGVTIQGLSIHSFSGDGILISGGYAQVFGNYVGTDPGGETDLGNGGWGVKVQTSVAQIGTQSDPVASNLISGNTLGGVYVGSPNCSMQGPSEPTLAPKFLTSASGIYSNLIGGTRGGGSGFGNSGPGVYFEPPSGCGSVNPVVIENYIRYNSQAGVVLISGQYLHLFTNNIHGNGQTAFDLSGDLHGANVNGANGGVVTPEVTGVDYASCSPQPCVTVNAQVTDLARGGLPVRFDYFHNDTSPAVPEGKFYMGSSYATVNGSGPTTTSVTIGGFAGQNVTVTATYTSCIGTCPQYLATSEYSYPKAAPASVATTFIPSSMFVGGSATLRVALANPNPGAALTGVSFALSVPVGLTVTAAAAQPDCFTGYSASSTATTAGMSGLAIPIGGACTFDIAVTSASAATYTFPGGALTVGSSAGISTNAAATSLAVTTFTPPTLSFLAPATTTVGANVPISFFVQRGAGAGVYLGLGVTVNFPGGATVSSTPNLGTSCSASVAAPIGGGSMSGTGGGLAPNSGCTVVTVQVVFPTAGTYTIQADPGAFSMSSPVAFTNSAPVTKTIIVNPAPAPIATLTVSGGFGNVPVGTTATLTGTLKNDGNAPLAITSFATSGAPFGVGTCVSPMAPSATCTFPVTFAPTTPGSQAGTITLVTNASGSPHTAPLSGTGTQPGISLAPSPASFGSVVVSTTSTLNVAVNNTGAAPLAISAIAVTGSFFTQSGTTCPASLPAGNNCFIALVYAPTATGPHAGQLSVSSNAAGSPHLVPLSGTGTAPGVSLTPSPVAFGNVPVGTSANATLDLTNTGTAPLTISSIVTTGAFFSNTTTCGPSLAAGASCPILVTYAPTVGGAHTGQVTVTTNAGAGPVVAPLSGTGAVPAVTLSVTSLTFGSQTVGTASVVQTVIVTNGGNAPLNLTAITATGDFNFVGCPTPLSIPPGGNCSLSVKFVPTAVGARTGGISIASNASGSPHAISLGGNGTPVPVPGIALAPASADFGAVVVGASGTQVLVLSNPGTAPLAISSIAATGVGFSQTNACPASLSPSAACNINVTFAPGVVGAASGQLQVVSNATPSPLNAALTGSGLPATTAGLTFSTTSVAFPPQFVATTSAPRTVTLTSSGTASLVITQVTGGGDFSFTGCGPSTLAPNTTCTFTITFKPQSVGSLTGSIVVTSNAAGSPHTVSLSGNGASLTAPEIVMSPSAFGFGTLRTGRTATIVGRLTNTGAALLLISQIQAAGSFFAQSNNCPANMAVGGFCDVTVTYSPTAAGAHSGQLLVQSNAIPSPFVAAFSGTGIVVPPPFLSPGGPVAFGQQVVGTTTRRSLVLTNTGGDPLVISSMAIVGPGAFGVEGGCGTIAPDASCTLTVTFLPTGLTTFNARLDIVSNHSGGVVQVALSGQGVALPQPDLDFSSTVLGFTNNFTFPSNYETVTVRLTNIGGAPINIGRIHATLPDYSVPPGVCVGVLAPQAFCNIAVSFIPLAPGPRLGSLVVDSTPSQSDSVSLVGTGCRRLSAGSRTSLARLCSP